MNSRLIKTLAVASAMAIGLFCAGPGPAKGEEDLGTITKASEVGSWRYKQYCYPSKSNAFFMFPRSYVTFDVVNGKYWMVEANRFEYDDPLMDDHGIDQVMGFPYYSRCARPDNLKVTFFTPDMKQLGHFEGPIYANHQYPVPRDGNDYERIICKIECESEWHWDVRFRVWDAVDPVMGEPMSSPIYRQ